VATGKDLNPDVGHRRPVTAVALLSQDRILATASLDGTVRLWETATGKELRRPDGELTSVTALAVAPDGKRLAAGDADGTFCIWDAGTGRRLHEIKAHAKEIHALVFTTDGKSLVSWSRAGTVHFWDLATAKGSRLEAHLQPGESPLDPMSAAVSPEGKLVFVGCGDGTVRVCETATGKQIRALAAHDNPVGEVVLSPDGKTLATASTDNFVRLWEVATGQEIQKLEVPGGTGALAFTADGKTLAAASLAGPIRLWDVAARREIARLAGHLTRTERRIRNSPGQVLGLVFSADGTRLVSGGADTTALVWDLGEVRRP
jgi:WD40 repeat protein